ncbi:hypothetical protein RJT34_31878 [Clitoria ternatea]|uniref:Uncharacterized protein n=1 Tax=Clitoria ternatea TaxID=43366 RepID=A0AAN9EX73_CLITE
MVYRRAKTGRARIQFQLKLLLTNGDGVGEMQATPMFLSSSLPSAQGWCVSRKDKETALGKQHEEDDFGNRAEKVQVVGEILGLEPSNGQEKSVQKEVLSAGIDQINQGGEQSTSCLPTVVQDKSSVKGVSLPSPPSPPSCQSNHLAYNQSPTPMAPPFKLPFLVKLVDPPNLQ